MESPLFRPSGRKAAGKGAKAPEPAAVFPDGAC